MSADISDEERANLGCLGAVSGIGCTVTVLVIGFVVVAAATVFAIS